MNTTTTTPRRTALVTGGTAGLGAAIAIALANKGYDVAITERPQLVDGLAATLAEIKKAGGRALAVPPQELAQAIEAFIEYDKRERYHTALGNRTQPIFIPGEVRRC